jgi:RHS repeat-associated protein
MTYSYDEHGNLSAVIDAAGKETKYIHDRYDRLTALTDPAGKTIFYQYELDKINKITDAKGQHLTFEYDQLGRPVASTTPDGKAEIYSYDTKGRISSRIDPHGIKIEYGYTDKDKLSTVTLHTNPIQTLTIAYDTVSNPVSYTDSQILPAPLYSYSYDEANRIISSSNNLIHKTIDYSYDHQGNVASMTMKETGGTALYSYDYLYDSASRLLSIQDSSTGTTTFSYFNTGKISGIGYPNGTQAAIVYNDNGMVDSINYHRSDSTSIEKFQYSRDSIGNITEIMMNSGSTTYNYDNVNRLTGADYPETSPLADELFNYDVNGNRSTSLQYSDWTYTTDNALTHYGNTDLDYDQNGNVIQQTVSSQTTTFGYDAFNRMRTVNGTGMNVLYQYDHFGRRISKEVNSSTRNFMYDGYRVMAEFDGSGNLIRRYNYIPGSSLLVGMSEGSQNFDVLNDSVSVPRRLVGNGEAVAWAGDYQAFGAMTVQEDVDGDGTPVQFNLRFPGQYFDAETGMHYNGQRMYDPLAGRFFSRDPVQGNVFVPPNLNSYIYAYNNPLIFVDQDGRRGWSADFAGALWDQFTSPTKTYNNFVAATRGKMGGITQAVTITFSAIAVAAGSYVFVASGALGATYELAELGGSAIGNAISRGAYFIYHGSRVAAFQTGRAIMSGASALAFFANTHPDYVMQEGQDFVGLMISLSGADTPPGPPSLTFSGVISEYVGGTKKYEQFGRNVKDFMNQAGSQIGIQSYNAFEWFIHNLPRYVGRRGRSSHGYGVYGMTYEMPRSL